ncbi:hypothetical protein ART_2945 [Arthrobacter sp. PAMC 25486]|uniref:hypothetical protein n=1 Tax=Arthrobacter sp. PAMC 25486 TaxID=1494608 RepID=UPI000535BF7C|nr:hypothetical protein [Arthrobacter sp. PAMC 25486]AIY02544.1 hypothetical protein ART_2945 [Arthrobacter sp. PAMC 25486]
MEQVSVRYIVHDVDSALEFYVQQLGFTEVMHPAPGFALLSRGRQALLEDPSGNVVELFEPLLPEAAHKSF